MANPQIKTLEEFVRLQQNTASFHVAKTGMKLGVIEFLASGQQTAERIAAGLKIEPSATGLLLQAMCQTGLVERYGTDFALSQMARLLPNPRSLNDDHWLLLEQFVREGRLPESETDPLHGLSCDTNSDALTPNVNSKSAVDNDHQQWMQAPAAIDAAQVLDFGGSRRGLRVLEVGGGSAVFSVTLAHRDPDSRFVLLDIEANLMRARSTAESVGLDSQFEFVETNPLSPLVPSQSIDLVLIVGQLHSLVDHVCKKWIASLAQFLKPAGELVVVDWFPGQEKGERTLSFYALELGLRIPGAEMHRPQLVREWLLAAGLSQVRYAHLPSPPHIWGLILAEKQ
jgi:SAM-dependent methyltransferase